MDIDVKRTARHGCGEARMWRSTDVAKHRCGEARMWRSTDVAKHGCGEASTARWKRYIFCILDFTAQM